MAKISFRGEPPVAHKDIERNVAASSGYPRVDRDVPPHGRKLAVVGGGPSLLNHVEELREWDGGIWAINGVNKWLRDRGIFSIFFALDPHPIVAKWAKGATDALICSRCDLRAFAELTTARVTVFDLVNDIPNGFMACSSSATAAFHLGIELGYRDLTFFGCEGSYISESHAYMDEQRVDRMLVECGGKEYLTAPDFYQQSVELSTLIKKFPKHFHERSGGLLRAMVEESDHDIVKVSRSIYESLRPA